jgi:hypothetical protein
MIFADHLAGQFQKARMVRDIIDMEAPCSLQWTLDGHVHTWTDRLEPSF